ncbi:hypothetical protein PIB30_005443 [Stylosanthes scabra]|uniref:Uncharacterized protein n=1 Tax=Stylosanthes scabra TaxID=79078 RepID=A0ABU6Y4C0_9FABA|nr:hypothetical protein [Stylosanthes scabra]
MSGGGSDENISGILQGGMDNQNQRQNVCARKFGQNRRALSVINQNLVQNRPYPCVVNKRPLPGILSSRTPPRIRANSGTQSLLMMMMNKSSQQINQSPCPWRNRNWLEFVDAETGLWIFDLNLWLDLNFLLKLHLDLLLLLCEFVNLEMLLHLEILLMNFAGSEYIFEF